MKVAEINERRVSISRVEEVLGWLGRVKQDPSERGYDLWRDEPHDREDRDERQRAA